MHLKIHFYPFSFYFHFIFVLFFRFYTSFFLVLSVIWYIKDTYVIYFYISLYGLFFY